MSRSWCFTLNNYTFAETQKIEEITCRYLIFGYEKGEMETYHLQGYIEFDSPKRLSALKKLIERAHFEKRMGTREQAREYCMKENEFLEFGDWQAGGQGSRNDLKDIMEKVKKNIPILDIIEEAPEMVARNLRFVDRYTALIEKEQTREFRKVEVSVYHGDAGTGKTRKVFEEAPKIFTVNCEDSFPFEGYNGEKEILIDDFDGSFKYHQLLRVLDGHQYRVNTKGSHRYARWEKVFITSNKKPEEWYRYGLTPALQRRLNIVTEFRNEERGNTEPALDI